MGVWIWGLVIYLGMTLVLARAADHFLDLVPRLSRRRVRASVARSLVWPWFLSKGIYLSFSRGSEWTQSEGEGDQDYIDRLNREMCEDGLAEVDAGIMEALEL